MEEPAVRRVLDAEREATLARIDAMTADFDGIVSASAEMNGDDEHDPEGSTIAYERAQVAALLAEAQAYLGDLDRAVSRLADGAYWFCERCGVEIPAERLAARPGARSCVTCAVLIPQQRP